jgi:hypothetical protein
MTKVARPTKRKPILMFVRLLGALLLVAVALAPKAALAQEKNGKLHVTKNCSEYTGAAGSFCTITSSNLAEIKVGTKVFYDQAAGIPTGMLDSNVVLDAGTGDWAVGRCTLDLSTTLGLCTFSDGTGDFAGFSARVDVSPFPPPDAVDIHWDGTYSFNPPPRN